jgi:CMP-N,N'-diacetyllegionaminic acid synthase
MRVLFLITARAGSKRVPGKNLARLGGIPLVGFKAISARRSSHCARLVVSTDSAEIQHEAARYGAEAPFLRPPELATDTATSDAVVAHAMDWVARNDGASYDAVMLLEPAAPFARATDYDAAVELMLARDANLVVGVRAVPIHSTFVGPLDERGRLTSVVDKMNAWRAAGRPPLAPEFTMNAALYLFRWDYFQRTGAIYGDRDRTYAHVMDPHYSIEIDEPIDLHQAEFMIERGYVDMAHWR